MPEYKCVDCPHNCDRDSPCPLTHPENRDICMVSENKPQNRGKGGLM